MCECEICKKWDRVLCGECTLKKFRELGEGIARLEKIVRSHAYVGVPKEFDLIKERLSRIERMIVSTSS